MQLHMFVDKTFRITIGFVSTVKSYIFDDMFTYIAFLNILFSEWYNDSEMLQKHKNKIFLDSTSPV